MLNLNTGRDGFDEATLSGAISIINMEKLLHPDGIALYFSRIESYEFYQKTIKHFTLIANKLRAKKEYSRLNVECVMHTLIY